MWIGAKFVLIDLWLFCPTRSPMITVSREYRKKDRLKVEAGSSATFIGYHLNYFVGLWSFQQISDGFNQGSILCDPLSKDAVSFRNALPHTPINRGELGYLELNDLFNALGSCEHWVGSSYTLLVDINELFKAVSYCYHYCFDYDPEICHCVIAAIMALKKYNENYTKRGVWPRN